MSDIPDLFDICENKKARVADRLEDGSYSLDFNRALTVFEFDEWKELCADLQGYTWSQGGDSVSWGLWISLINSPQDHFTYLESMGEPLKTFMV